jgi:hypothetical protein
MHSISVFLINKKELRNEKIDSLNGDNVLGEVKFTEMNEDILATTSLKGIDIKEFIKDKTIAEIETDYFGGMGHQSATLKVNGKVVYSESNEFSWDKTPINDVLKMMGVIRKKGMDEFDTIELGKYRSNECFK